MKKQWKNISKKYLVDFTVEQANKSENISFMVLREDENKIEYSCIVEFKNKKTIEDETVIAKILEKLDVINTRLDGIDTRLDKIETRIDKIESRIDKIESRIDVIEVRLDKIENRLDVIENDVKILKEDVTILKKDVDKIKRCPTIKKELELIED